MEMLQMVTKKKAFLHFGKCLDPRTGNRKMYSLAEILFLVFVGGLLGVESWRGLATLGKARLAFLRKFFAFAHGIPAHQTIGRLFSIIKPKHFEHIFATWAARLHGSNAGKHLAFDGKFMKNSGDKLTGKEMLQLVHVFAVKKGLCLAQLEAVGKDEGATFLEILDSLDVTDAMLSGDALHAQKETTAKIITGKADFTLTLKKNQPTLFAQAEKVFATIQDVQILRQEDRGHGRITSWEYSIIELNDAEKKALKEKMWSGIEAFGRCRSETTRNGQISTNIRYYILSYCNLELFAKTSRNHWAIENNLHWVLDTVFDEDASRKRKDHAPRNYAIIRKFVLNVSRAFKGEVSIPGLRIQLAASNELLEEILVAAGMHRFVSAC